MDSKGTIVVQKGDLRTLFDLVCSPLAGHNPIKYIHAALHRGVCLKRGSTVLNTGDGRRRLLSLSRKEVSCGPCKQGNTGLLRSKKCGGCESYICYSPLVSIF